MLLFSRPNNNLTINILRHDSNETQLNLVLRNPKIQNTRAPNRATWEFKRYIEKVKMFQNGYAYLSQKQLASRK